MKKPKALEGLPHRVLRSAAESLPYAAPELRHEKLVEKTGRRIAVEDVPACLRYLDDYLEALRSSEPVHRSESQIPNPLGDQPVTIRMTAQQIEPRELGDTQSDALDGLQARVTAAFAEADASGSAIVRGDDGKPRFVVTIPQDEVVDAVEGWQERDAHVGRRGRRRRLDREGLYDQRARGPHRPNVGRADPRAHRIVADPSRRV